MLCTKCLPVMLALCLMLLSSYYTNYAGIIGSSLTREELTNSYTVTNRYMYLMIFLFVYVFTEYFLHSFSNLALNSWECNTFHVAVINILK